MPFNVTASGSDTVRHSSAGVSARADDREGVTVHVSPMNRSLHDGQAPRRCNSFQTYPDTRSKYSPWRSRKCNP
jgi:hypothetical protein